MVKIRTYRKFFVSKGTGESDVSSMNSFDAALKDAKVFNCNLVPVSSIIPVNYQKLKEIPSLVPGMILYCVLARANGKKGEQVSSALSYGIGKEYGIVAEIAASGSEANVKTKAEARLKEMAKIRTLKIIESETMATTIPKIKKRYGCAVIILGFLQY